MTILSGLKGYRYQKANDLPPHYFRAWLKEKWKADLAFLFVFIIMSPLLVIWGFGILLMAIGGAIVATKNLFPDSLFLEGSYRDKQFAAADAARDYVAVRAGMSTMDDLVEELCEDEGCPQRAIAHICITKKDPAV